MNMCARLRYILVSCECLVAPDAIYNHVKTYREEVKNVHYAAPEYAGESRGNPGVLSDCVVTESQGIGNGAGI